MFPGLPHLHISLRNFSSCKNQHLFTILHVRDELNCLQANKVSCQAIVNLMQAERNTKSCTYALAKDKKQ